jgi:hypothetical protein
VEGQVYAITHEELVTCAIFFGPEFNINNGTVYDFLQSLTLNGPAWSWINSYQRARNGRAAWKALVAYYKGDAMRTRSKQDCYQMITHANYQGPHRNYDFNTYVSTHQQAHQELPRLGEPVPENKKVRDFLSGISDPLCTSIKLTVLSSNTLMNNFLQAANYVAGAIDMMQKNPSNKPTHQVAQTTSTNSSNNASQVSQRSYYNRGGRGRFAYGSQGGGKDNRERGGRFYPCFGRGDNNSTVTSSSTISTLPTQSGSGTRILLPRMVLIISSPETTYIPGKRSY